MRGPFICRPSHRVSVCLGFSLCSWQRMVGAKLLQEVEKKTAEFARIKGGVSMTKDMKAVETEHWQNQACAEILYSPGKTEESARLNQLCVIDGPCLILLMYFVCKRNKRRKNPTYIYKSRVFTSCSSHSTNKGSHQERGIYVCTYRRNRGLLFSRYHHTSIIIRRHFQRGFIGSTDKFFCFRFFCPVFWQQASVGLSLFEGLSKLFRYSGGSGTS